MLRGGANPWQKGSLKREYGQVEIAQDGWSRNPGWNESLCMCLLVSPGILGRVVSWPILYLADTFARGWHPLEGVCSRVQNFLCM